MSEVEHTAASGAGGFQAPPASVERYLCLNSPYLAVLPFAMIVVAYLGTLSFQFVYDDPPQVLHNPLLHSWRNLPGFFTHDVWNFNQIAGAPPTNYYRPIFLIWLLINYSMFGARAWCWHLTTVGVHFVVTLLVYRLAMELTRDRITALFSAAIFGLHPIHIEAVAWISGVSESLVAAPFLGSLLCHVRARVLATGDGQCRGKVRIYRATSLALCILALLSKETAIVLPATILLYEIVFRVSNAGARGGEESWYKVLLRALRGSYWYVIVAACYLAARFVVLKGFGRSVFPLRPSTIILTWPSIVWFYIKLLVWPFGLSAFYETPYVHSAGLKSFVLPLFLSSITVVGVAWILKRSYAAGDRKVSTFCAGLMVLPILPLLNLSVFVEGEIAHDRYLYLPSVGFCILLGMVLRRIRIGGMLSVGLPAGQAAVFILLLCVLAGATALQTGPWSSDLLLYHRGFTVAPGNKVAKNNLAIELSKRGFYDEAIGIFERALAADPDDWIALSNIGYDYFKVGRLDEADRNLTRAIDITSMNPGPFLTLGLVKQAEGRLDESARYIREAINLRANGDGFHEALGNVLRQQGDILGALAEYRKEIELNPERSSAREQLGEIETILRMRDREPKANPK